MGIGNSNITKKQWAAYEKQFAQLTTKEQRNNWLANGTTDAMLMWDMKEDKEFWVPMINHVRLMDDSGPLRYDNRIDALTKARDMKKDFLRKKN